MEYHILVAEDDPDIVELLKLYLEGTGYQVFTAENGEDALKVLEKETIHMAVLDVMMPRMDGYELTKRIREKSYMPILILSAKDQDHDKILGLNLGADDYLTKPFNPLEIIARIQANLRRCYGMKQNDKKETLIKVGDLKLDMEKMILYRKGKKIPLTATEFKILAFLMKNPGRIYTKIQIMEEINGEYFESDNNAVMVHISKIRDKIEDGPENGAYIKTIRGVGYKIEKV